MQAVLVSEFGIPEGLTVCEVPDPTPGPGEVVVEVAAASVNFPDVLVVEGTYQVLPKRPFSPGKEAAGRVLSVGAGVEGVAVGDRVLAILEFGAFAEQVVVPEEWLVPLPTQMSFEEAAAFGLVASTAHLALFRRACLRPGETLLVTGAGGGVGSLAVQLGKAAGCTVLALARSDESAEIAVRQGADVVLRSSANTLKADLLEATAGRGVDVVMDVLGGDFLTQAMRATVWEGRVVIVGFAAGSQNPIKPGHLLVKNLTVMGLQSSDYRDRMPSLMRESMLEVFSGFEAGKVRAPIAGVLPLTDAARALRRVKEGEAKGKLVLVTGLPRTDGAPRAPRDTDRKNES